MKMSMMLTYSGDPRLAAAEAADLERAGIDVGWVPELYGFDAVSILGYLAAKTETMELGSGIFNIYGRTPSTIAMTAAGLDAVSSGRFILGLGASGPQVIEGFHGVKYDKPLGRQREIMDICRKVWRRERVVHDGPNYQLPLPEDQGTGLGKPLKLINHPVRDDIPIYLASLGPKNVELTAEVADGWLPAFFHPDKADGVWKADIDAGLAKRDPALGPMQVAGRVVLMLLEHRVSSVLAMTFAFAGVVVASLMLLGAGVSPTFAFAFAVIQGGCYGLTSILKPAITAEFLGRVGRTVVGLDIGLLVPG